MKSILLLALILTKIRKKTTNLARKVSHNEIGTLPLLYKKDTKKCTSIHQITDCYTKHKITTVLVTYENQKWTRHDQAINKKKKKRTDLLKTNSSMLKFYY